MINDKMVAMDTNVSGLGEGAIDIEQEEGLLAGCGHCCLCFV